MNLNNVRIKSVDNPQFVSEEIGFNKSLLSENRIIQEIKPSCNQNKKINKKWYTVLYHLALKIINKAVSFLPFRVFRFSSNHLGKRTFNHTGIVAAFDRSLKQHQTTLDQIPQTEVVSYFERLLEGEEVYTTELKDCMHAFKSQSEALMQIQALPPERKEKEQYHYVNHLINEIKNLKNGQFRLIQADSKPGNQLFYLFSREERGVTFKIIGRGESMVELSGIEEVAMMGKVKIPAAITYEAIPQDTISNETWLQALFLPILTECFDVNSVIKLTRHLQPYRRDITQVEVLSKKNS